MRGRKGGTEFGPFRLFPAERRLLKGETPVQIGSRALDILIALVERAGEVVPKHELLARVWPDVTVEESSLRVHVAGLRKALADGNDQARYIVNVAGRGYTFVVSPADVAPLPARISSGASLQRPARVIGRERDIDAIAELLAAHRFVTVHGAGGIGKTTVGLTVGAVQALAVADGVCFVDLGLNSGVHTASDAVASALGLAVRASDSTENVLSFVRHREMLVVLDSCEAMIDAAAALAERLVQEAPGVAILATSREPLRARGEHVYPLAPLTQPPEGTAPTAAELLAFPAAQLFCERAVASGYLAGLDDADAVIVADICRRVDGNALALELAASRVCTYGLSQTAELLDSHMKLAWQGRRTAPPRHQTLNAMLEWSYALIGEHERGLLRQLSVFAGAFALEDARGVAEGGDEAVIALEQLVLKSLVATDTSVQPQRFRLLDTTRAYAKAKLLESGAVDEVQRRHARHYLDLMHRFGDRAAVQPEHVTNIRTALEWAFSDAGDGEIALALATCACDLFLRLGMLKDCRNWSERALAALSPNLVGSRHDMVLRSALGHAMMFMDGSPGAAREALEHALGIADQLNDTVHQFRLLGGLHMYHRRMGALGELLPIGRRAEAIASLLGGAATVAAQAMLGVSHHLNGDLVQAHAALVAVRDTPADPDALGSFYGFYRDARVLLARTLWQRGFPDQAAEAAALDETWIDERKEPVTACLGLIWGVTVYYLRGDWGIAEDYIDRLVRLASEHSLRPYKWFGMALRGALQLRRGDVDAGVSNLRESLRLLKEGRYDIFTPWLTCCLAEGLAARQDTDQAFRLIDEIKPDPGARPNVYMPEFLRVRGVILAQMGDVPAAEHAFRASLDMADDLGALSWRLRTVSSQASLRLKQGRLADAREALAETYGRFTEGFETLDLRTARALIAEIDARRGESAPI